MLLQVAGRERNEAAITEKDDSLKFLRVTGTYVTPGCNVNVVPPGGQQVELNNAKMDAVPNWDKDGGGGGYKNTMNIIKNVMSLLFFMNKTTETKL